MKFYNETLKRNISLDEVAVDVLNYICEDSTKIYNVFVGADSQREKGKTCYVTIVSITREGCGGKFYIHKTVVKERVTMRDRIWTEAFNSVKTLQDLLVELEKLGVNSLDTLIECDQVHADVGLNGKSKELVNEITGYIEAYGFKAVIKPDAFVAQCIANKFTKKF